MSPATATSRASASARSRATVWGPGSHILELDGVRGLAILIVTLYRFGREIPTDSLVGRVLHDGIALGDRGVDLFFVLSGFLITGVLLDTQSDPHCLRNFFARRTLRIFPLYFASLLGFLVLVPALWPSHPFRVAQDQQVWLWSYLANFRMAAVDQWCFGAMDHFWSLAVEEHFYLLWPFCVLAIALPRLGRFALVLAGACAVARIGFAALSSNQVGADVLSVFRFDGLLIGGAIAAMARRGRGLESLRPWALMALPLAASISVLIELHSGRLLTIGHSFWAVTWASLLVVLLSNQRDSFLARTFRLEGLRTLGRYSYAMYIFQSPLIPLAAGFWSAELVASWMGGGAESSIAAHLVYMAGMFAATLALALLSWHLLEKHCLRLKRFVSPAPLAPSLLRERRAGV